MKRAAASAMLVDLVSAREVNRIPPEVNFWRNSITKGENMNNSLIRLSSVALPIFTAHKTENNSFLLTGNLVGTCIPLGGEFMLTASHVASEFQSRASKTVGVVGLYNPNTQAIKGAQIIEHEILSCDISIIKVDFSFQDSKNWIQPLPWRKSKSYIFEDIKCFGYPYGLYNVDKNKSIVLRGFKGYIVSNINAYKPIGYEDIPFSAYELSFQAPRGLSGSPIISEPQAQILGIVIGNSKSSMLIFDNEETEEESGKKTIVQHYESLSLGVAVSANEILGQNSALLGSQISDFLLQRDLLFE